MSDEEIILAVAKLDGWEEVLNESAWVNLMPHLSHKKFWRGQVEQRLSKYLTSRDAIIPVIEKCCSKDKYDKGNFIQTIRNEREKEYQNLISDYWHIFDVVLCATPRQLCIALLKATGNWKD